MSRGRTALVTGAGVRLGRAIALALAERGIDVAVHFGRSRQQAFEVVREIEGLGRRAVALCADLSDPAACLDLVDRATESLGSVEVLVNSAALFRKGGLREATLADFDDQIAVNLRAPWLLTQRFAQLLPNGREGVVVNVGDARTNRPGGDHLAYRLAKAGLEALTRDLALDLAPHIRVVMVAPGAILPAPGEPADRLQAIARERIPLARHGSPAHVGTAVVHLVENTFLTGVVLPVDGGEWL